MAIENVDRIPPQVALLNEIDGRRRSMAVIASGMGPVLDMLREYIVTTEARIAQLEAPK